MGSKVAAIEGPCQRALFMDSCRLSALAPGRLAIVSKLGMPGPRTGLTVWPGATSWQAMQFPIARSCPARMAASSLAANASVPQNRRNAEETTRTLDMMHRIRTGLLSQYAAERPP